MIISRDRYWDSVKGCAIIAVVLGHGFAIVHDFVYSFHLALFFFVSGWFYNEKKYGDAPELNFAARIKSTWPKYVTYSTILIFIHLVLQDYLGIEMVRERFSIGSAFVYCLESCIFRINDYLTGSMWFIPQIIFSSSLFGVIVWLSRRELIKKYKQISNLTIIMLCMIFGAIGSLLDIKGIEIAGGYHLQYVMKSMPIYMAAYYSRKHFCGKGDKALKLPLALLCLVAILLGCRFHIEMGIGANPISFYVLGLSGIYFSLFLCKIASRLKWLQKGLSIIGEFSFEIMAGNVVIYFISNAVFSRMSGTIKNAFSLNYYQQYWYIQLPALLGIPCIVGVTYKKLREKLLR